jgi:hypothetical protein
MYNIWSITKSQGNCFHGIAKIPQIIILVIYVNENGVVFVNNRGIAKLGSDSDWASCAATLSVTEITCQATESVKIIVIVIISIIIIIIIVIVIVTAMRNPGNLHPWITWIETLSNNPNNSMF